MAATTFDQYEQEARELVYHWMGVAVEKLDWTSYDKLADKVEWSHYQRAQDMLRENEYERAAAYEVQAIAVYETPSNAYAELVQRNLPYQEYFKSKYPNAITEWSLAKNAATLGENPTVEQVLAVLRWTSTPKHIAEQLQKSGKLTPLDVANHYFQNTEQVLYLTTKVLELVTYAQVLTTSRYLMLKTSTKEPVSFIDPTITEPGQLEGYTIAISYLDTTSTIAPRYYALDMQEHVRVYSGEYRGRNDHELARTWNPKDGSDPYFGRRIPEAVTKGYIIGLQRRIGF